MRGYDYGKYSPKRRAPKRLVTALIVFVILLVVGGLIAKHLYDVSLGAVSNDQTTQIFTVTSGSSVKQIASNLEKQKLIRSAWAMDLYVHSKGLSAKVQAGTYALSPSESTPHIVSTLSKGQVSTRLVTILPGRRIDQVRADLINAGFTPSDVDKALDPAQYADLPVLALKPAEVTSLEGLLWPESFQKDATTGPDTIIRQSLQEMSDRMTADVQAAFAAQGLSPYQGLILTSIITQEVSKPSDQPQVAQVFLSRLHGNISLGSDVTARYGAIAAGRDPADLNYDSPYNTHLHTGLPPTPISTVTANALSAATHPATTNWLFFVTGDDGTTYFSNTLEQHQALTQKYCHKLCSN